VREKDYYTDNYPDYCDYIYSLMIAFKMIYPEIQYPYFRKLHLPRNTSYKDGNQIPTCSIEQIERIRELHDATEERDSIILKASSLVELGFPATAKNDTLALGIMKDRLTDGFLLSYPHGIVMSQKRGQYLYRGENCVYGSSRASGFRQ